MSQQVNSNPYFDGRHYKTPCERCGVLQSAQFCSDCFTVDPEMTAGGRRARAHQKYMAALQRRRDRIEFHSWVYGQYDRRSAGRGAMAS